MSKNIRIRTEPNSGNSYIKVQLNQDFDFLEILSLKIRQEDVYRNFYSDYGVVVGRAIMNNGVGIPNAKVSIFIPLTDEDAQDPEISALYPYSDIAIVNGDGVRYNLLPEASQGDCHTPVGTFPNKNKLIDNDTLLEVYDKYYKYSTTTNDAGDFMLFGVPVGNHLINLDVDLSDIGIYSQRPYDFTNQGNPAKLFTSPTKFKSSKNLNSLTQIRNRQMGINVIPFWGENQDKEVGISRVDIDLNYTLEPKAIFIGSLFGDNEKNSVNKNCIPRKRLGRICEMSEGGGSIQMLRKDLYGENERFDVDGGYVINDNGAWAYQIPMNLDYMVTNEYGDLVATEDPTKGIATRTNVRFKIGLDPTGGLGRLRTTANYLVPNNPANVNLVDYSFDETTSDENFRNLYWNKIYTVKNHITRFQKKGSDENRNFVGLKDVDDCVGTKNPIPYNTVDTDWNPLFVVLCIIIDIIVILAKIVAIFTKVKLPCNDKNYRICAGGFFGFIGGLIGNCSDRSKEFKKCIRLQLAEQLNVYEMDFYNDWLNGSLYAYLLKYKKKKNVEKFCGGVDSQGNFGEILNTNTGILKVTQGEQDVDISEGLVVNYKDELFYKPITKQNNLLYATDIYNLGSVFDCDWQGKSKTQDELIPTTYQFPEFEQIDIIFEDIGCLTGIKLSNGNADNIAKMCEIAVDVDEEDFTIDENDLTESIVRSKLMKLNTPELFNTSIKDIDNSFESSDYKAYRNILDINSVEQSLGNSLYFYFGPSPNKSAINLMNSKYFTQCLKPFNNPIKITGVVTDVTEIEGSDGTITVSADGGTPEYTYSWTDSTGTVISLTDTLTGLEEGIYTVEVTDGDGRVNNKRFTVTGIKPLQMSITTKGSLPGVNGDGIIYVNSINGGVAPYSLTITGGQLATNISYEGLANGVTVNNLNSGVVPYIVTATDSDAVSIMSSITINEVSQLLVTSLTIKKPSCKDGDNGEVSFEIQGGTPSYAITLVGNGQTYRSTSNTNLESGTYTLTVYDSYGQSSTPQSVVVPIQSDLILTEPTSNQLLLTNTRAGDSYNVYKNTVFVETIIGDDGTTMYNPPSNQGTYQINNSEGCESNPLTI